jgi:hypothetical protein
MDPLLIVLLLGATAALAVSRIGRRGAEPARPSAPPAPKRPAAALEASPPGRSQPRPEPKAAPGPAATAPPPAAPARERTAAGLAPPSPTLRRDISEPRPAAAAPSSPPPVQAPEPEPRPEEPPERRKHRRLRSDQTFTVTPFAGREMMAECKDVSLGGVRFAVVGYDLREDELMRVTFNLGQESVSAIGRVARLKKLDPITIEAALEFVRIDPWAERLFEELLVDCE